MARRTAAEASGWSNLLVAALAGAAAATAVTLGLQSAPRTGVEPDAPPVRQTTETAAEPSRLEGLETQLRRERDERRALAFEVAQLRASIEAELAEAMSLADESGTDESERPGPDTGDPAGQGGFDSALLNEAGVHPADVELLRERWANLELAKLEIQDQALREGWLFTPRQRSAIRALEQQLEADLGEELYDAYLYATGSPNRVVVRQVVPRSTAAEAGLQAGDVILRYDRERIYQPGELRLATSAGARGERVDLEVVRDGRRLEVTVTRGPLGILLDRKLDPPPGR